MNSPVCIAWTYLLFRLCMPTLKSRWATASDVIHNFGDELSIFSKSSQPYAHPQKTKGWKSNMDVCVFLFPKGACSGSRFDFQRVYNIHTVIQCLKFNLALREWVLVEPLI